MHGKYAKDGLAAVSVSLDNPADKEAVQRVRAFLTRVKANFTNVILDEKEEVWQEKLKVAGPPVVWVFDRKGKWTRFESGTYEDVEKLVVELLQEK